MRWMLYYMVHSFKNQIKKLFRTWVAVFILVCVLIGVLFGLGAGFVASVIEKNNQESSGAEEVLPPEEEELPSADDALPRETLLAVTELAAGGILLVILVFSVLTADKSGSSIFLMADVNLLFPAPIKPQSVLLFRLLMQAASSLLLTVYLIFQIPNLMLNLGLGIGAAFAVLGTWFFTLLYGKLLSVLLYTLCATHPGVKKRLRPGLYLLLLVVAGAYLATALRAEDGMLPAAFRFFNAPGSRYVPLWGWLKALMMFGIEGRALPAILAFFGLLAGAVILILVIRSIRADFYEDAMARSAETAEIRQAAESGTALQPRKKDRSEKLQRDRLNRGQGASVYFHKAMYNRFRFAHGHIFTKTAETDLLVGAGLSLILLYVIGQPHFPIVALALSVFTFFRALGNPVADDVKRESFFLVPDSAHKKLFFSFLGGAVNSALDLLPAFLAAALLLRADPVTVLLWYLLTISIGTYADSVGVFIDLSLSTGLSRNLRAMIQLIFIYFGLAPAAALLAIGFAFGNLSLFAGITALFCLAVTAVFLALSPLFLMRGRR